MQPAAWMIFIEARGWRPPAPRPRPRGEERERERREEERDGGGGLGVGVDVEAVVLGCRLWGGRYAMAAAHRRAVRCGCGVQEVLEKAGAAARGD